ncbi:response regulator transcription factor [Rubrivirga sp. S365]|uniref:response regulator n=1 Tax=Rubrivirga sp. S365 TaxID=3076080 RepID=UPI0028CA2E8D|nr:response regulator transcription factor [Rubrivirga sp. S365]MDT7856009.1 response regulator transcription factor [Rubrivirga sp. S365]
MLSSPHRVFLVEDHPVMREAYAALLATEPRLVLSQSVETAEEALDALRETPCDLVLTDLRLPGMSGVDLVRRLSEERPGLPALVISAHHEEVYARRALEAGAARFLPKQGLAARLVSVILEVLDEETPEAAFIASSGG